MRGDRVEVVVDTGQGVQTFDIAATKNGRRIEVTRLAAWSRSPR
jgi:hypothetical protein